LGESKRYFRILEVQQKVTKRIVQFNRDKGLGTIRIKRNKHYLAVKRQVRITFCDNMLCLQRDFGELLGGESDGNHYLTGTSFRLDKIAQRGVNEALHHLNISKKVAAQRRGLEGGGNAMTTQIPLFKESIKGTKKTNR